MDVQALGTHARGESGVYSLRRGVVLGAVAVVGTGKVKA